MKELKLLSSLRKRKQKKALLKRLTKSYKAAHAAWVSCNYHDFYFDERIASKLGMTLEQFEEFQKKVVNTLSQYCKVRQERIFELVNSDTL